MPDTNATLKISIVLPTLNEAANPYFKETLKLAQKYELIICDGGSMDETLKMAEQAGAICIENCGQYRADRLNAGIKKTTGQILLLHHPRSRIDESACEQLILAVENSPQLTWGAFTHAFDQDHPLLKFTSFYSNHVRPALQSVYYLDHCIFFVPDRIQGSVQLPSIPIFEDTELSKILRRSGRPVRLKEKSVTSSVRFSKNGVYRQAILNQVMKVMYLSGFSKPMMDRIYEAGLKLNSK